MLIPAWCVVRLASNQTQEEANQARSPARICTTLQKKEQAALAVGDLVNAAERTWILLRPRVESGWPTRERQKIPPPRLPG